MFRRLHSMKAINVWLLFNFLVKLVKIVKFNEINVAVSLDKVHVLMVNRGVIIFYFLSLVFDVIRSLR